ncbi:alpha-xylosidase, partial [Lactobacillus acidophilus]
FPDDPGCEDLDMQYMLGGSLLVAPIFNDQGEACFYAPQGQGKWISLLTNESYEGGRWYKQKFNEKTLPLLVKPNSIIVTGEHDDQTMYDYTKHPSIHLFEMQDGKVSTIITDNYGKKVATVTSEKSADKIVVTTENIEKFDLIIHRSDQYAVIMKDNQQKVEVDL